MDINLKYIKGIKKKAALLGFDACGISTACSLDNEARRLERWLRAGMHGRMKYLEGHFEKRIDPRKLVDGAKSIISVLMNYYPPQTQSVPGSPALSKYAYGTDYHYIIKDRLFKLLDFINETIGEVNGRAFVDSAPVLDRTWAARSGLGWVGKNSCLLSRELGSFFFIGELIVDIELPADTPSVEYCGSCTRCMDACPTGAIVEPGMLDARKCISYLTIEYRDDFPSGMEPDLHNRVFGCDICQDACPWNRNIKPHREPLFEPGPGLLDLTPAQWYAMDRQLYKRFFRKSSVGRAGYRQLRRNLECLRAEKDISDL